MLRGPLVLGQGGLQSEWLLHLRTAEKRQPQPSTLLRFVGAAGAQHLGTLTPLQRNLGITDQRLSRIINAIEPTFRCDQPAVNRLHWMPARTPAGAGCVDGHPAVWTAT